MWCVGKYEATIPPSDSFKGKENIGMAMTFTLVSHLREHLVRVLRTRIAKINKEEREKERLELEVRPDNFPPEAHLGLTPCQAEAARTRGTPVTAESFKLWKTKFDKEMAQKKASEEEERLKALTPKEREESKKYTTRLTGMCYLGIW
jgi:hypothetical protein